MGGFATGNLVLIAELKAVKAKQESFKYQMSKNYVFLNPLELHQNSINKPVPVTLSLFTVLTGEEKT